MLACASPQSVEPPAGGEPRIERSTPPRSELVRNLLGLARQALEDGDLDRAEQRFRRVRNLDPGAVEARAGLAEVALRRGNVPAARLEIQGALAAGASGEAVNVDLALVHAEIEERAGRFEEARRILYRALRSDPRRYDVAGRLESATGRAPQAGEVEGDRRLERAVAYPFDPRALIEGAHAARASGSEAQSKRWLSEAVWLADIDREASRDAFRELGSDDSEWAGRRWVPVHVYADETVRSEVGWKNRLRLQWRGISVALDPLLHTAFVPVSFGGFESGGEKTLAAIDVSFRATAGRLPAHGLVAAFTEIAPPRKRGDWKLGQAGFFGRDLLVRLEPGAVESRVLAHEILHIYGGVHIADALGSLMNPGGQSLELDPANVAVARISQGRRFGPGGIAVNVLPHVDTARLAATYLRWLDLNLGIRKRGMENAWLEARTSRYVAAAAGEKAARLDPHMADVASFTGYLLWREGESEAAANLYGLASRLYGRGTSRGRAMQENADRIRVQSP